MSELLSCPYCGGEMHVRLYDEDFYRAVLGTEYECDPDYEVQHVDRLAAVNAKCPLEIVSYKSEADAIAAWNMRAVESANGLVYIASFRDNGEFPERIWASLNGEAVAYIRERTCCNADDNKTTWFICSECGDLSLLGSVGNYCPNCGARVEVSE